MLRRQQPTHGATCGITRVTCSASTKAGSGAFVDRRKDILRRRGANISSLEVERELLALPGVREAAVVAAPSDFGEDEIKAVVVMDSGCCRRTASAGPDKISVKQAHATVRR
jgi:acyl-coenzyme A synthetase/AMP-(fatty) acid ligase